MLVYRCGEAWSVSQARGRSVNESKMIWPESERFNIEFVEVELRFPLKLSQYSISGDSWSSGLLASGKPQARHPFQHLKYNMQEWQGRAKGEKGTKGYRAEIGGKRQNRESRENIENRENRDRDGQGNHRGDYSIDNREDHSIEDQLRREARRRTTNYEHPHIELTHQPINATECQEMQQQLRELVAQKVATARNENQARNFGKEYEKVYQQFVSMAGANEVQQRRMCSDIKETHEMADMLLHPPSFTDPLQLYSSASNPLEAQDYSVLFSKYEKMHKAGYQLDENQAEQIIRKAKLYYLRDRP